MILFHEYFRNFSWMVGSLVIVPINHSPNFKPSHRQVNKAYCSSTLNFMIFLFPRLDDVTRSLSSIYKYQNEGSEHSAQLRAPQLEIGWMLNVWQRISKKSKFFSAGKNSSLLTKTWPAPFLDHILPVVLPADKNGPTRNISNSPRNEIHVYLVIGPTCNTIK